MIITVDIMWVPSGNGNSVFSGSAVDGDSITGFWSDFYSIISRIAGDEMFTAIINIDYIISIAAGDIMEIPSVYCYGIIIVTAIDGYRVTVNACCTRGYCDFIFSRISVNFVIGTAEYLDRVIAFIS